MSIFELKKTVWTDLNFDSMGWHDCHVHSIAFQPEAWTFLVDLDYIFQWVAPQPPEEHYKFWVAPATLIFKNAHTMRIDIESEPSGIEIADLTRGEPRDTPNGKMMERLYRLECQEGVLELWATGFELIVRREASLRSVQVLDHDERGGICFGLVPYET